MPDVSNIFKVPLVLYEYKIAHWLANRLGLKELHSKLNELVDNEAGSLLNRNSFNCDDLFRTNQIMSKWVELNDRYSIKKEQYEMIY